MVIELDRPGEKCGIIGIYNVECAARNAYFGLFALQHRGQESAGISSAYGDYIFTYKNSGLVPVVFNEDRYIKNLVGDMAIGHVRYSTSHSLKPEPEHTQPINRDENFVLAHNGNIPVTKPVVDFLESKNIVTGGCNDSDLMYEAIRYYLHKGACLLDAVTEIYKLIEGVYACVAMTPKELVAFQDRCAMKPLCLGKLNTGYVLASETCALDIINAKFIREINPGEVVSFNKKGKIESRQPVAGDLKRDSWEFVYFARPDSNMLGRNIGEVRENFGRNLAKEHPADADVVVGIPDSGTTAAIGYALASGIPYRELLIKNRYVGRTFIKPSQNQREEGARLKLNPIKNLLKGLRVILVDDSIVRGTTTPKVIKLLKNAGAKEIHMRIASSPYRHPDYYGTDTPIQNHLIAANKTIEEIRRFIGATSLGYLSFEGALQAIGLPESQLSTSWFTGVYPISIGKLAGKI